MREINSAELIRRKEGKRTTKRVFTTDCRSTKGAQLHLDFSKEKTRVLNLGLCRVISGRVHDNFNLKYHIRTVYDMRGKQTHHSAQAANKLAERQQ